MQPKERAVIGHRNKQLAQIRFVRWGAGRDRVRCPEQEQVFWWDGCTVARRTRRFRPSIRKLAWKTTFLQFLKKLPHYIRTRDILQVPSEGNNDFSWCCSSSLLGSLYFTWFSSTFLLTMKINSRGFFKIPAQDDSISCKLFETSFREVINLLPVIACVLDFCSSEL